MLAVGGHICLGLVVLAIALVVSGMLYESRNPYSPDPYDEELSEVEQHAHLYGMSDEFSVIGEREEDGVMVVIGVTDEGCVVKLQDEESARDFWFIYDPDEQPLLELNFDDERRVHVATVNEHGGSWAGHTWVFHPEVVGYPHQAENMAKLADLFR